MVKLILLHGTLFFCMAWGVLEEEMDKLDFVFTEFSDDGDKTSAEGVGE